MAAGFAIAGVKELEKAFTELGKTNTTAVLRSALIKAAKPTVMAGRAGIPRRTGRTARSVIAKTTIKRRQGTVVKMPGDVKVYIGPTTPQAHLVEFGTKERKGRGRVRASGAFTRAWESTKSRVLKSVSDQIWASTLKKAKSLAARSAAGKRVKLG